MFNNAKTFVMVKGIKVNFSKYLFSIGPEEVVIEAGAAEPRAALMVPVKNLSGKARKVKIERHFTGADGREDVETRVVDLGKGKAVTLKAEDMAFEAMRPNALSVPGMHKFMRQRAELLEFCLVQRLRTGKYGGIAMLHTVA